MVDYARIIKLIKNEVEKETAIIDEMAYKRGYAKASKEEDEKLYTEESYAEGYLDGTEDVVYALFKILEMDIDERRHKFGSIRIMEILKDHHPLDILKEVINENKESEYENKIDKVIKVIKESDLEDDLKNSLANYIEVNEKTIFDL